MTVNPIPRAEQDAELVPADYPSADRNPAAVYLAGLAEGSRRTLGQALDTIAGIVTSGRLDLFTLPWHFLRYQHTAAIRAQLLEGFAPATANKMLSALRGVLKQAWRLGYISAEDYQRAADLPSVRGETLLRGRALTAGELHALFRACDDGKPGGARDAALLAVLYGAGLRRSEAAALNLDDYKAETGELRIHGKGRKDRLMPIAGGSASALEAWLDMRGGEPGSLFCPVNKADKLSIRSMTAQAILKVLVKRAKMANVATLSPHDLRRSYITHLLDAGADALNVQKLAGHSNTQTTLRYDRRDEKAKRKVVELLHVPFSVSANRSKQQKRRNRSQSTVACGKGKK